MIKILFEIISVTLGLQRVWRPGTFIHCLLECILVRAILEYSWAILSIDKHDYVLTHHSSYRNPYRNSWGHKVIYTVLFYSSILCSSKNLDTTLMSFNRGMDKLGCILSITHLLKRMR